MGIRHRKVVVFHYGRRCVALGRGQVGLALVIAHFEFAAERAKSALRPTCALRSCCSFTMEPLDWYSTVASNCGL